MQLYRNSQEKKGGNTLYIKRYRKKKEEEYG